MRDIHPLSQTHTQTHSLCCKGLSCSIETGNSETRFSKCSLNPGADISLHCSGGTIHRKHSQEQYLKGTPSKGQPGTFSGDRTRCFYWDLRTSTAVFVVTETGSYFEPKHCVFLSHTRHFLCLNLKLCEKRKIAPFFKVNLQNMYLLWSSSTMLRDAPQKQVCEVQVDWQWTKPLWGRLGGGRRPNLSWEFEKSFCIFN